MAQIDSDILRLLEERGPIHAKGAMIFSDIRQTLGREKNSQSNDNAITKAIARMENKKSIVVKRRGRRILSICLPECSKSNDASQTSAQSEETVTKKEGARAIVLTAALRRLQEVADENGVIIFQTGGYVVTRLLSAVKGIPEGSAVYRLAQLKELGLVAYDGAPRKVTVTREITEVTVEMVRGEKMTTIEKPSHYTESSTRSIINTSQPTPAISPEETIEQFVAIIEQLESQVDDEKRRADAALQELSSAREDVAAVEERIVAIVRKKDEAVAETSRVVTKLNDVTSRFEELTRAHAEAADNLAAAESLLAECETQRAAQVSERAAKVLERYGMKKS
ncbi:hypothetical protein I8H84_00895 [Candidatus Saccharibacteria bacterium]|nr:hypothetical protein [Candidatus Saccharibacteria bacterium]MBH1972504.1 hypothetical protein [Candidatus Saccharibacteria bacterium]MBH1990154.1 hypothetical protein [Candidatus Saccharibacteria bacterium]OGL23578.1 MAG: hypothetical protein A2791_01920 [Candidatus Saccharibacteria bacterium RIFCSPHIGHO2_01_FULL_46_30]